MNTKNKHYLQEITTFHGIDAPERGVLVGYATIIDQLGLPVPIPTILSLISFKRRQYKKNNWQVFTSRHLPEDTLYDHLVFALKYEGINLLFFKKLFDTIDKKSIEEIIKNEPLGIYSRKIWFLYEWLLDYRLNIENLKEGNYILLVDDEQQYANPHHTNSTRHRIKNNLPGSVNFCPLIRRTDKLDKYVQENLSQKINLVIQDIRKDILLKTSAFLLLKDSKASFNIEGENPIQTRAIRWGRAIEQAGTKPLSGEELLRLQQIVIERSKFVKMGYRTEGGFVGEHDRDTGEPIPEHISARYQDIETLIGGLLDTATLLEEKKFHPVLSAAVIAFGFVFIHPFVDGNGRIHRYLIHHFLVKMGFTPQHIIFPVSAAILERINDYKHVLESYSQPLLEYIDWKKTKTNNIEVLNNTIDYYRYFDATLPTEFLFECVNYTINKVIPQEVDYLQKHALFKQWLDDQFQMPDRMVSLLIRFLEQNDGVLSKRAREKEFLGLTDIEAKKIELTFKEIFKKSGLII